MSYYLNVLLVFQTKTSQTYWFIFYIYNRATDPGWDWLEPTLEKRWDPDPTLKHTFEYILGKPHKKLFS